MSIAIRKLTLLIDYRAGFWLSDQNGFTTGSMNVQSLVDALIGNGFDVRVVPFSKVDVTADWRNELVLYQSSEDDGLHYKSFIEDLMYALELKGAILLPSWAHLHAHHNKVFAELYLDSIGMNMRLRLEAKVYGALEEYGWRGVPVVLKSSAGAGSRGVRLASTLVEAQRYARELTRSRDSTVGRLKELVKRAIRRGYVPHSFHREKILVQEFVPQLRNDFKVLVYASGKAFVLKRLVRENDFRASGGGINSWPEELPAGLLDAAFEFFIEIGSPALSLDIVQAGNGFKIIEWQALHFGQLTIERSTFFWIRRDGNWERVVGTSHLESTLAEAVVSFVNQRCPA